MRKTLFTLAIVACCSSFVYAQRLMLQYNLPKGKKLNYHTTSKTEYAKGSSGVSRQIEAWFLRSNPDGSSRVIFRRTSSSYRETGGGTSSGGQPEIDWARCDLFPDGRTIRLYASGDFDPNAIFIPLPADTLSAKKGWEHHDDEREESDAYHLDSKSLRDTLWAIEVVHRTPLDEVYQIISRALVYINVRQGLPIRKEAQSTQGYGNRRTSSTTTLDTIAALDPVWVKQLEPQLEVYLRADSLSSDLAGQAEEKPFAPVILSAAKNLSRSLKGRPGEAVRLLTRADSVLKAAREQVTDSGLAQLLDKAISDNDEAATRAYVGKNVNPTDSLKNQPAPEWRLTDLDGATHALTQYRGKVVLLDFWYRGCPWCIRAMPQINELAQTWAGKPVQVLGMNIDKDTADARFVVNKLKLRYPQLRANDLPKPYRVTGYPTLFVVGQDGIIRDVLIGYERDLNRRLSEIVLKLLSGK